MFSGNAHLVIGSDLNSGKALDLGAGQSVALNAVSPSQYRVAEAIEPDSWDSWNADRDQELAAVNSARTQATGSMGDPGNAAWGDLDANGNWYNVPGQGYVWSPNEAAEAGFDPYANGNWFWTPGSGYVWVSGYSWGYMPYQCGLWNYYDGFGWGWSTGMNGCNPWWDTGYVAPNIATSVRGYLAPLRPHLPVWRVPGRPPFSGPRPMIAVHRAPLADGHPAAARDKSSVVTIAGATVLPLRPLPLASSHFSSPSGGFDHSRPVNMPGFPPAATNRSAYGPTHAPAGAMPAGRPAQSAPASGSSGARSSPASSSHSSASTSSAAHSSSAASSSSSGSSHSSSSSSSGGKK